MMKMDEGEKQKTKQYVYSWVGGGEKTKKNGERTMSINKYTRCYRKATNLRKQVVISQPFHVWIAGYLCTETMHFTY